MQQESIERVSESLSSSVLVEKLNSVEQDVEVSGPSRPKLPRVEISVLKNLSATLKKEISSENECLLLDSQKAVEAVETKNGRIHERRG